MSEPICIDLPRSSDTAELARFLTRQGLPARVAPGDARIDIRGDGITVTQVLAGVEEWLEGAHLPFVPVAEQSAVVVRPPGS